MEIMPLPFALNSASSALEIPSGQKKKQGREQERSGALPANPDHPPHLQSNAGATVTENRSSSILLYLTSTHCNLLDPTGHTDPAVPLCTPLCPPYPAKPHLHPQSLSAPPEIPAQPTASSLQPLHAAGLRVFNQGMLLPLSAPPQPHRTHTPAPTRGPRVQLPAPHGPAWSCSSHKPRSPAASRALLQRSVSG